MFTLTRTEDGWLYTITGGDNKPVKGVLFGMDGMEAALYVWKFASYRNKTAAKIKRYAHNRKHESRYYSF